MIRRLLRERDIDSCRTASIQMNYFAHGRSFLAAPYFLVGTAVPDLIRVAARKSRVREKHAQEFLADENPAVAAIAAGIAQHHVDDAWFHKTSVFAQLSLEFTVLARNALPDDEGFRPSFLGHILVELLLDSALIAENKSQLDSYYQALADVDADLVQAAVSGMATHPVERFSECLRTFQCLRFLYDYLDDVKLCYRLNQVMRRVGLPELPGSFVGLIPRMRSTVVDQRHALFTPD
ncbi:MAG: hypothetical protein MPJ50_00390 [Pirellulales bacterium]|nr:hypothetical protein [Pirellulales bacterium]